MEEVTVKVEAGIQPFGRPIAESAEAHEGEEGRLKAEAAKGHDSDKTAGAQERAVDESEDDGDDDADYKIVKTDPDNPTTAAVQSPSEGDRGNFSDQAPARSDGAEDEDEDEDVEGEEEEEDDDGDDDGHGEEEEDDTEDVEANLTNLSDLALIAGAANGRAKPKSKPKSADRNRSGKPAKRRPLRSASEITQEELSSCFHLPSEAACRKLGIGLTVLKRQCRKFGIKRWPFRKMKSLDRLITNVQAGISPGDQNRTLVKSVEELEEQKRRMEECQVLDLDENTKRLQQAYSKANHKARRMAQAPELGGLGGLLALSSNPERTPNDKRGSDASTAGVARGDDDHVNSVMSSVLKRAKAGAQILDVAGTIPVLGDPAATITAAANAIQEYSGGAAALPLSTFTGLNPTQQNILAALASAMNSKEPGDRSSISAFTTALINLAAQGKIEVQPEAVAAWQNAAKFHPPQGALTTTTPTPTPITTTQQQQRPSDAATNPFAPALDPGDLVDGKMPVTAVTGRWSPARPARKFDANGEPVNDRGAEVLEELLVQRTKRGRPPKGEPSESESEESESEESESEESEEEPEPNEEVEGEAGRSGRRRKPNPKYQEEKTPKKKKTKKTKKEKKEKKKRWGKRARTNSAGGKGGDVDDADPLASLALAALGAAKTAKPVKASAVPAEHPAFALAQQKNRTVVSRAPPGAGLHAPRIDKSTITLVVTEHADRLRDAMLNLAEGGARRWPREGPDAPASQDEKQAISDAIGVEALKLRDALNEMLLPQGGVR